MMLGMRVHICGAARNRSSERIIARHTPLLPAARPLLPNPSGGGQHLSKGHQSFTCVSSPQHFFGPFLRSERCAQLPSPHDPPFEIVLDFFSNGLGGGGGGPAPGHSPQQPGGSAVSAGVPVALVSGVVVQQSGRSPIMCGTLIPCGLQPIRLPRGAPPSRARMPHARFRIPTISRPAFPPPIPYEFSDIPHQSGRDLLAKGLDPVPPSHMDLTPGIKYQPVRSAALHRQPTGPLHRSLFPCFSILGWVSGASAPHPATRSCPVPRRPAPAPRGPREPSQVRPATRRPSAQAARGPRGSPKVPESGLFHRIMPPHPASVTSRPHGSLPHV